MLLSRNFDMDVFSLTIAAKDVGVALESAETVGAHMPLTEADCLRITSEDHSYVHNRFYRHRHYWWSNGAEDS